MCILCNLYPNQDVEIYITAESSLMLVCNPSSLILFIITQASGLWHLVQDVYCPAVEVPFTAESLRMVAPGVGWCTACVLWTAALHRAHECTLSYKYSDGTDRTKAPLAPSLLHWDCGYHFVVILPDLFLCILISIS